MVDPGSLLEHADCDMQARENCGEILGCRDDQHVAHDAMADKWVVRDGVEPETESLILVNVPPTGSVEAASVVDDGPVGIEPPSLPAVDVVAVDEPQPEPTAEPEPEPEPEEPKPKPRKRRPRKRTE